MNYLSLILRIAAILSAGIAGVLYFSTADKIEEKEKEISRLRSELQTLVDNNDAMSLEVTELQEKLLANDERTKAAQIEVEEAKAELVAEMQESQRLQNKVIEIQREVSRLEETNNRLHRELLSAENASANASKEGVIAQLSDRVEELTKANQTLRTEVMALKGTPIDDVVPEASPESEPTKFSVRTLTASEADAIKDKTKIASLSLENGIIVLDADPKLKLAPNTFVKLVKGQEVIAEVKVININGSLAIANILPDAKLDNLAKGDTVKLLY